MISVLVLTKYGNQAASSRQRFEQYKPALKKNGIELIIKPLLDDKYLLDLFNGRSANIINVILCYLRRIKIILFSAEVDVIWVQYELFPYLPSLFEKLIALKGKPIIYDFDDAIFHQYDSHKSRFVRKILGKKLEPLLSSSNHAICGNSYLEEWASEFTKTSVIPTVVNTDVYKPIKKDKKKKVVIGWIGSPATWEYVEPYTGILNDISLNDNIEVIIVGSGEPEGENGLTFIDWSEKEEVRLIQMMDIGIMPLRDDLWARGKCGYKLIQYMSCGLPVVASPVGVNVDIIDIGVNGFLATDEKEWIDSLHNLISSSSLRIKMGEEGRKKVINSYSLESQISKLQRIFIECQDKKGEQN